MTNGEDRELNTGVVDAMRAAGQWNGHWDGLAALDPKWTEDYLEMATRSWRNGVLDPKVVELLCIAVDAACTHLYEPGVRRHVRAALQLGVTAEEVLEVLKLATVVGLHSCNVGVPILVEELAQRREAKGQTRHTNDERRDADAPGA